MLFLSQNIKLWVVVVNAGLMFTKYFIQNKIIYVHVNEMFEMSYYLQIIFTEQLNVIKVII